MARISWNMDNGYEIWAQTTISVYTGNGGMDRDERSRSSASALLEANFLA